LRVESIPSVENEIAIREVAEPEIGSNEPDIAATTEVGEEQQQHSTIFL
jgi:hypothetical protein